MPETTPTAPADALTIRVPELACPAWCRANHDDPSTLGSHKSEGLFGPLVHLLRFDDVDLATDGTLQIAPADGPCIFIDASRSPDTASIGEYSRAEAEQIIDGLTRALAELDAEATR